MIACSLSKIKTVQQLIGLGAEMDIVADFGFSTLSEAAWCGHRRLA